jgi:hypothetical protein
LPQKWFHFGNQRIFFRENPKKNHNILPLRGIKFVLPNYPGATQRRLPSGSAKFPGSASRSRFQPAMAWIHSFWLFRSVTLLSSHFPPFSSGSSRKPQSNSGREFALLPGFLEGK